MGFACAVQSLAPRADAEATSFAEAATSPPPPPRPKPKPFWLDPKERDLEYVLGRAQEAAAAARAAVGHAQALARTAARAEPAVGRLCPRVAPGRRAGAALEYETSTTQCHHLVSSLKAAIRQSHQAVEGAAQSQRSLELAANATLQALLNPAVLARPAKYNAYMRAGSAPEGLPGRRCHMECAHLAADAPRRGAPPGGEPPGPPLPAFVRLPPPAFL
ncbi:unnamed protein product [Prorocentrum cordatum]|uniref:Uncharacterized protein n=1 Tax=Prorocentrum cordatum TaxID=2364126 RepID=A0ABN9R359_9DINO|nr:unnamed protein product [Polarella glacialis]